MIWRKRKKKNLVLVWNINVNDVRNNDLIPKRKIVGVELVMEKGLGKVGKEVMEMI